MIWLYPHHNHLLLVRSEMLLANWRLLILPNSDYSHLCILKEFGTGPNFEGICSPQIAHKVLASINVFARRMFGVTNHTHLFFLSPSVISFCSSINDTSSLHFFFSFASFCFLRLSFLYCSSRTSLVSSYHSSTAYPPLVIFILLSTKVFRFLLFEIFLVMAEGCIIFWNWLLLR